MAVLPDLPLPPGLRLGGSFVIRVAAIDPATGAVVSGVNVGNVNVEFDQLRGPPIDVKNPILIGVNL